MSINTMKLALEALELAGGNLCEALHHPKKLQHGIGQPCPAVDKYDKAITALRQAIEQAQKQEPVAWRKFHEWMVRNMPGGTIISDPSWWAHHIYERFIRDTSPPQRQPLTDEQASDGFDQHSIRPTKLVSKYSFEAGVRYAEAAHGITGEQK